MTRTSLSILLTSLLAGCSVPGLHLTPTVVPEPVARAPRSGDLSVALLTGTPAVPHTPLALVRSGRHEESDLATLAAGELRAQALAMGGDAVIRVHSEPEFTERIGRRPGALFRVGSEWTTLHRLSGTVVRFDRPAPPESPDIVERPVLFNLPPASPPAAH